MSHYLPPGQPIPPTPPARANSYLQPTAVAQHPIAPSPPQPPVAAENDTHTPHHATLLAEWKRHHGSDWVRADALHPAVRQLIDPKNRAPAIRQRLRLLVNKPSNGFTLETKTVGNRARPVAFYRPVESKQAGLEG